MGIYILWIIGFTFLLLVFLQLGLLVYKIYTKKSNKKVNIVLIFIFGIFFIIFMSTVVLMIINRVISYELSFEKIGKIMGESTADVIANYYDSFNKNWKEIIVE